MKNKLIYSFLLTGLCFLSLSGCSRNSSSPKENIITNSEHLKVDDSAFQKTYETGDSVDFSSLKATFDSLSLSYGETINEDANHFYVIDNPSNPNSAVKNGASVQTTKKSSETPIYVAYRTESNGDVVYYVSAPITLTINNSNALSPWVLYTVTGVVFVALIGFSFWKSNKIKKQGQVISSPSKTQEPKEPVLPQIEKKENKQDSSSDDEEV